MNGNILYYQQLESIGYVNDQVWKRYQRDDKFYCFTLRIGKQMDGYSDNNGSFVYHLF